MLSDLDHHLLLLFGHRALFLLLAFFADGVVIDAVDCFGQQLAEVVEVLQVGSFAVLVGRLLADLAVIEGQHGSRLYIKE